MSDTLGTYSFLPWLRLGMANNIAAADNDPMVKTRASIEVKLSISGKAVSGQPDLAATVSRNVALYGPGDIVGIDPKAVVKVEPRDWITNFETNYMPYIEFYDEDFPWRYTPAAPDLARRLAAKAERRATDEARRPLAHYRADELAAMRRNFFGFDPSYHVARHHFVHRKPHAWTPRHLATHRR